jgi:regulator of protease activity HflC (stomatin/prohibitin superfamily)
MNPKDAEYNIENYTHGIVYSTITNMRNIVGDMTLDEVLSGRDRINSKLLQIIDEITDAYGIKILSVEIKNIMPPAEIQNAMEKQMRAERERREAILRAEGEKTSTILVAEGKKQSLILEAEAEKEAAILRAEATKEATIREAEGQAEAILKVQHATAQGLRMIKEQELTKEVISIRSLEAFEKAADGKATKIIIPSEIQNMASLVTSIKELSGD